MSTIDFAAVSSDRRTNDSNMIKSSSTQKRAVDWVKMMCFTCVYAGFLSEFFKKNPTLKFRVLDDITADVKGEKTHLIHILILLKGTLGSKNGPFSKRVEEANQSHVWLL